MDIYNTIYEAIKNDNVKSFSISIIDNENLCFGRFPLLTTCYIMGAKRIIRKFEKDLIRIDKYKRVDEPFDLYKKFKEVAKKALRIYANNDFVVSPLEMLAILKEDFKVKRLYKRADANFRIRNNLVAIYKMDLIDVKANDKSIKINYRRLNKKERKWYSVALICFCAFAIMLASMISVTAQYSGLGIKGSAYKLNNVHQLLFALNSTGQYVLEKDVTIDSVDEDLEFKGVLDGKGHTLYVDDLLSSALLNKNSGTIKNLNIVYSDLDESVSSSTSLFVNENAGIIDDVNISVENITLDCEKTTNHDIYFSAFVTNNIGTIKNSELLIKSGSFSATGEGECYVGGFAGINSGTIEDCVFKEESKIETNEIDASGISALNEATGVINKSTNNCHITQTSSLDGWSPTVSGITLSNYGEICNSINKGELSVVSSNEQEEVSGMVYIAGISAHNFYKVEKCLNDCEIIATTKNLRVYAGGITAYNQPNGETANVSPEIDNCIAKGNLNITTEHENAYTFVGGIAGYLYGDVRKSFSSCTFTNGHTEEKYFVGLVLGIVEQSPYNSSVVLLGAQKNYVCERSNVSHQIGSRLATTFFGQRYIDSSGGDLQASEIQKVSSEQDLKTKEGYWNV